jgi:uncharacterized protein involved in outer membrane biogenesis/outer membrane protein OmpA-like peptidoglycan-associated protein
MRASRIDDLLKRSLAYLRPWGVRAGELARARRTRKIGLIVVAVIAFLGIATYFAVPPVLRHVVTGPVAKSIHRQVSVGKIGFNLYRLRLDVDKLHVSERDSPAAFVDVRHLRLKVSWASLFRFAPVIGEVAIDRPAIHVVRASEQRFNFSDLLEGAPPDKSKPPPPPSAPMRFAVSNIQIRDGDVQFEDQLLGEHHAVEHIHVNVPFVANLPQDVDVFVEPLVEMIVDGSRLHIAAVAKPFGASRDSVVDLKLHKLDLRQYLGYVPRKLPIKIPKGTLSADVYVHFLLENSQPLIRLNGTVALDQLDVRDAADAPLIALTHGEVKLTDVEPLGAVVYLRLVRIDGLTTRLVRNPDGSNNLSSIMASNPPPPPAAQTQATITQPRTMTPVPPSAPMDFALESFELVNSVVELTDKSSATPAAVALDGIHVGVMNLRTIGQVPATYDVSAKIRSGGSIAIIGGLNLAQAQATSDVALNQIDLPALQAFAQSAFAGNVGSGKLNAKAALLTHFASGHFNLHAGPASVSIDNFEVHAPRERETPAQWKSFSASIGEFDLAQHTATINEVRANGMHLFVRREHSGRLSLESLMRGAPAPPEHKGRNPERVAARSRRRSKAAPAPPAAPAAPPGESWKYQIASIALEQTDATFEDHMAPRPIKLALAPLNLHLKDVSSDLAKPIAVDIDGTLNRKGTFKVTGTAAPSPLKADLRVATKRVDLSFADPYVSSRLNATITSANLTMDGAVGLAQERKDFIVSYRGDATLGNVRMLDKLTNDLFFRMAALNVNKIDFALGKGPPKVHIGEVALNDFYSRIILNSTGKLNFKDITAGPQEAPTSLTRAAGEPGSKGAVPVAPTPTATPSPAAEAAPQASPTPAEAYKGQPMNADIELSKIVLKGGKVDYTDNFIKPNYTANLSDMEGKVGAFGTKSTSPADVSLDGKINDSAPINIDGSVNPLAPTAFVDIKANANGIELTGLTPYTTKYTGFPIVKGTLTVDVHYHLDQGKLTADNHIFIDQLTFGNHVDSPDATNLPIRLAVSLLKNSKGQIDVRVPVSGSLSDPQFSIGKVILSAFMNLIVKAATSPFTLISAAFGGNGEQQDLGYIEFAPGYVNLTPESQQKLDTVAKALQDRTALRLNISGRADPQFDKEGYREASLEHSIDELRRKDEGDGADAKKKDAALSKEDYNKYLSKVYSAGKFQKQRDLIGLAKKQPPDEMKKLILANTPVTDQDLQHIAEWRANAVRAYLSTKGVDPARMFVIAPKLNADGIKDKGKTTRVDLSLE